MLLVGVRGDFAILEDFDMAVRSIVSLNRGGVESKGGREGIGGEHRMQHSG